MTKLLNRFNSTSALRAGSVCVLASLLVPLAGCGSNGSQQTTAAQAPPPAIGSQAAAQRPSLGLSTKQKVVLLAGAAALYYYYQKSKKATAARYGTPVQYYRSKNGGIYYRDPKTHAAQFVTPPTQTSVSVDPSVLQSPDYAGIQQAQGYNGAASGKGLDYYYQMPAGATQ